MNYLIITTLLSLTWIVSSQVTSFSPSELRFRLKSAATEQERINLLSPSRYVFDYSAFLNRTSSVGVPGLTIGKGGRVISANANSFPALIGHGISMTLGLIDPCGINNPHTHPRATEMLVVMEGEMRVGFFMENGAQFVGNTLKMGQVSIFPQGSIHFEINTGCTPALFVAAFNSEDPGVQTTTASYFGLPADIVANGFETPYAVNASFVAYLASTLNKNPGVGLHECYARCGLNYTRDAPYDPAPETEAEETSSHAIILQPLIIYFTFVIGLVSLVL